MAVGLICAGLGAGASAIATAGASTPAQGQARHGRLGRRALMRRVVQGQLILATRHGFVRVRIARGQVKSVSGQVLTLIEGTRKASYRTVQLTLPANTRVRDDHQRSTLSQVKAGQRAIVIRAPKRTLVIAHTPPAG